MSLTIFPVFGCWDAGSTAADAAFPPSRARLWGPLIKLGILGLLLSTLTPQAGFAATELAVGTGSGVAGSTVLVPIRLTSNSTVVGAQFDVSYTPGNLFSDGAILASPLSDVIVDSRETTPGVRRVLVYSKRSEPLPTGVLVNVPITIAATAPQGAATIQLSDVVLSDGTFKKIAPVTTLNGVLTVSASGIDAHFTSVLFDRSVGMQLELTGNPGRSYSVQTSPDLRTWTVLGLPLSANGSMRVSDTNALTLPQRFYRALLLP